MDKEQRDAQLRGSLLTHARLKFDRNPEGWVTGSQLVMAARDEDRIGLDVEADAEHATQLLEDLCELQFLAEQVEIGRGIGKRTLAHRRYRITDKGRSYCWGELPEVPGVEVP